MLQWYVDRVCFFRMFDKQRGITLRQFSFCSLQGGGMKFQAASKLLPWEGSTTFCSKVPIRDGCLKLSSLNVNTVLN